MNKLNFLNGWGKVSNYFTRRSAQSFMGTNQMAFAASGCGAGDDAKPAAACGASDDGKPASACGAGDDDKDQKPSSCGSSCGAGDDKYKRDCPGSVLTPTPGQYFN